MYNLISSAFQAHLRLIISVAVTAWSLWGHTTFRVSCPHLLPLEGLMSFREGTSCLSPSFWPHRPHWQSKQAGLVPGLVPRLPPWPLV